MFKAKIEADINRAVKDLGFIKPTDTLLSIQENPLFGDYSSNVALQLSKQKHKNSYQSPREIANAILDKLGHPIYLKQIEIAGPGFINFYIKDDQLIGLLHQSISAKPKGENPKRYLMEYGDPNTHKMLHIGHLVPLVLGESMARLLEYSGIEIYRVNYGSDIGLTVGKCLWGISRLRQDYEKIKEVGSLREKAEFLGRAYAFAHKEYTSSEESKREIDELTKKVYERSSEVQDLWLETTQWSLAYFDTVYSLLGIEFDRRINESEVAGVGKQVVLDHMGSVFIEDQGAVIFPGERHGLHNRVFLNSSGNPTYEAKDIGLTRKYLELNHFDRMYSFAHREQNDYFRVVLKANELIYGEEGKKRSHISFGELRLPSGKMSSREGNVIAAEDMISDVAKKLQEVGGNPEGENLNKLAVGAIKFWFLKYSVNSDIVFDIEKSVSLHGDSGPYVMYVYARIRSLLNRAKTTKADGNKDQARNSGIAQKGSAVFKGELEEEERMLLRKLEYFETVAIQAGKDLQPNLITSYLLDLAKLFNLFYERCPVLVSDKQEFRLLLSAKVSETVKLGLYLLGIETVDRM